MKCEETARRLRQAMYDRGVTASDLASKSGVSKSSISQYMNGSHAPSNISSSKIAVVLKVNPLWLMGFDIPDHDAVNSSEILSIYGALDASGQEQLIQYGKFLLSQKGK